MADPDPDSEQKSDPDPGKKTGSETLDSKNLVGQTEFAWNI